MHQDRSAGINRPFLHLPAGGGRVEHTLGHDEQVEILARFLESDEVRDRPPGVQRHLDEVIALCVEAGEVSLAMALWALMALRMLDRAHVAAGMLMSDLAQLRADGLLPPRPRPRPRPRREREDMP